MCGWAFSVVWLFVVALVAVVRPSIWIFSKKFRLEDNDMAYNKAREEKKWRLWKEAEEKKLRELGVDEDTIEQLRIHDWAIFNSDRRYYQRMQDAGTYLEEIAESEELPEIKTVEDFLDSIENQQLYQLLIKVDKLTLQIALWKMEGYNSSEISERCGLSVNAVNFRMWHLRKKLKNLSDI